MLGRSDQANLESVPQAPTAWPGGRPPFRLVLARVKALHPAPPPLRAAGAFGTLALSSTPILPSEAAAPPVQKVPRPVLRSIPKVVGRGE